MAVKGPQWTFNPGELKRKISLERDTLTRVDGAEVKTPTTYAANVWAKAEALSGRELLAAQQIESSVNWRFTVRYRTDILPRDRVVYNGKHMEIRVILPDEDLRDFVWLLCEAR